MKYGNNMNTRKYAGWNTPMNEVTIQGERIEVPIRGGTEEATLTTWREIRKLGCHLRGRAF